MGNNYLKDNTELMKEYDYKKNKNIDLDTLTLGSNKKIWWICSKGHEWETSISKRTIRNNNCPYCSNQRILKGYNDLATINPNLAQEWNYNKNSITPFEIGANSSKKVWWKCHNNHEWEATVASRNNGNGCPICTNRIIHFGINDFETLNKHLMPYWNYQKNKINPKTISVGYNKKIWWKCPKCDHEWYGVPPRATRIDTICPNCSSELGISFSEKAVYYYLKKIDDTIIGNYRSKILLGKELDIYIPKKNIGIEYDGGYYHRDIKRDLEKDKICNDNNIVLYRIREKNCKILNSSSICLCRNNDKNDSLNTVIKELIYNIYNFKIDVDVDKDRNNINDLINFIEKEKSLLKMFPDLTNEWNYKKNGKLKPEYVMATSGRKVWWLCSKGHEWEATIASRSAGNNGCPYCSNHIIKAGYNDLKTLNPFLAKEWNYSKNKINPNEVGIGTTKKVWWICSKCKYEWQAAINSRVNGNGCPKCGKQKLSYSSTQKYINKQGSFEEKYPELLKFWDYEKNDILPSQYPSNSQKKVWWKCKENHSYEYPITNVINGSKCPYCSNKKLLVGYNDFKSTQPNLILDWNYQKNKINPEDTIYSCSKKIWWKCHKCGYEWQTKISNRTIDKKMCPKCSVEKQKETYRNNITKNKQSLFESHPNIAKEWNYEKNELDPNNVTKGSSKKVWWICSKCGYEWQTKINHRTSGSGCPNCYRLKHSKKDG